MCISTPKIGASNIPAPTQVSATDLQLGTAALTNRSAGVYGRLALTGGSRGAAARQINQVSLPTQGPSTTADTPQGTLGLPSDYLGDPVYGGLKPKVP